MKTKLLCGLIASMLLCGTARASELLTYLASTPLATATMAGSPKTIQLPGFNSALGTLTEVKLSYWGEVWQTRGVENMSTTQPMSYTLSGAANLTLTKAAGGPALFASPTGTFTFSQSGNITAFYDGILNWGGPSGFTLERDNVWSAPAAYFDSNLASYLTTGMIDFISLATATGGASITAGSGSPFSNNKASATLQVDYTYVLIPEPSTYAAGLGLVAFGAAALRRRRGVLAA